MSKPLAALLAGVLALSGCTPAEEPAPVPSAPPAPAPTEPASPPSDSAKPDPGAGLPSPEPAEDECGAAKLAGYMNQLPASDTMAKVRQTVGHDRIRTIRPGDAVTMDYRPDRLNVELGEDGRIKRLRCG